MFWFILVFLKIEGGRLALMSTNNLSQSLDLSLHFVHWININKSRTNTFTPLHPSPTPPNLPDLSLSPILIVRSAKTHGRDFTPYLVVNLLIRYCSLNHSYINMSTCTLKPMMLCQLRHKLSVPDPSSASLSCVASSVAPSVFCFLRARDSAMTSSMVLRSRLFSLDTERQQVGLFIFSFTTILTSNMCSWKNAGKNQ